MAPARRQCSSCAVAQRLPLHRQVEAPPPLFPRSRVVSTLVQARDLMQREPGERGPDAALAVDGAQLARVDATPSENRERLLRGAQPPVRCHKLREKPVPRARDTTSARRHDVETEELVDAAYVEQPRRPSALGGLATPGHTVSR